MLVQQPSIVSSSRKPLAVRAVRFQLSPTPRHAMRYTRHTYVQTVAILPEAVGARLAPLALCRPFLRPIRYFTSDSERGASDDSTQASDSD